MDITVYSFIHGLMDIWLLSTLVIINSAALNICVHVCVDIGFPLPTSRQNCQFM